MMWTTSQRLPQLSTADRARPSGGKRRPRLSTPCCDQRRLALRRPVETEQDTSLAFGNRCHEAAVHLSMGSAGDSYDTDISESFFPTLECELLPRRPFRSQAEA